MTTKRRGVELGVLVALIMAMVLLGLILNACQQESVVVFEGKDTLLRPTGYREWVFVGSSLGLRYHNAYINPLSFRTFEKTGQYPDGTVMVPSWSALGRRWIPPSKVPSRTSLCPPRSLSERQSALLHRLGIFHSASTTQIN